MPEYKTKKVLGYSPQQLFDMVLDVDRYEDFLPWCRRSEVIDHLKDQNKLYASVTAGYMIYSEMYVSKVTYERHNERHKWIKAEYIEGPFKNLKTTWQFDSVIIDDQEHCDLMFDVVFEFSASVLNTLANHVLDQISSTMVDAFIARAEDLYGKPQQSTLLLT